LTSQNFIEKKRMIWHSLPRNFQSYYLNSGILNFYNPLTQLEVPQMAKKNKSMMTTELAEKIALHKFSIIAPVINGDEITQTGYFKKMAEKFYDVPGIGRKKYQWKTFKSWLNIYRAHGFEGLKPQIRNDKGKSRVIDKYLHQAIEEKLMLFPKIKIPMLHLMLTEDGLITEGSPCENTLRKYVDDNDLKPPKDKLSKPRKKFEKPFVNDLWLSDFMHGDHFIIDEKKQKLFLCGMIDDHSRMMTGCRWMLRENSSTLELVLKDAVATYGIPKAFYCDNGSVYVSHHLQVVCARLGIALIHSKPYDSPSRGKIERFWRTVRDSFMPLASREKNYSLDDFNRLFADWLNQHYHRRIHHGIGEPPLERYLENAQKSRIRRISQEEIELVFQQTFIRKVNNDATISVDSVLFEVPPKYIGTKIELRHPTGQPFDLWIYENNQPQVKVHKVDPARNSQSPFSGIRFADSKDSKKNKNNNNTNNEEDRSC
jgi:putative transposase